ncbi:MAG: DUF2341 domain-containing protein [Bacteroidales bacterium]|nr:DUF2341 domain-containing protein [Bacteroidales bacterium]
MKHFFLTLCLTALSTIVMAQPCMNGYKYRRQVTVTNNNAGTLTHVPVQINLDTYTLIGTGKMQTNAADIRVVDGSNNVLTHWVEPNSIYTANTKVWVKIPSLATGATSLYLFYGNPADYDAANGDSVFTFFDDFNLGYVDNSNGKPTPPEAQKRWKTASLPWQWPVTTP